MARIVLDEALVDYLDQNSGCLTIARGTYGDERGKWIVSVMGDDVRREVSDTLGLALATVVNAIRPPADPVDVPDNPTDRQRIEAVANEHSWTRADLSANLSSTFWRDGVEVVVAWTMDGAVRHARIYGPRTPVQVVAAPEPRANRRDIVLGVLVQTEHDPMARALAAIPPLAGSEPVAAEPKSRAEQIADAADRLDDAAIKTTARLAMALDIAAPDDAEVDQLVRTVHRAAEAAAMLRRRAEDAKGRPACDPEQQVDPAVVVRLRSQLDQIREAASMAHQAQTPGTAAFVLAEEILTIARCPQ